MIKARMIVEVMGWPKEAVNNALEKVVDMMKEREQITIIKKELGNMKKLGEKTWSNFIEIEAEYKELKDLVGAIIDFGPISVEIISPDKVTLNLVDVQDIVTDFVFKMQQINNTLRKLLSENILLKSGKSKK